MKNWTLYFKRASPVILTGLSAVGVVATAVLSAKAARKAERLVKEKETEKGEDLTRLEKIATTASAYIPAIVAGSLTVACVVEANLLGRRQQIAIASAYAATRDKFDKYRAKLKDIYGDEAHRKIMDELSVENSENAKIEAAGLVRNSSLDFHENEELRIFYDTYADRYFESTFSRVLQAEYHLNRNFVLSGGAPLNEWFVFLGLSKRDNGDAIGWSMAEGYEWIDFDHHKITLKDGSPCFVIDIPFEPKEGFLDW